MLLHDPVPTTATVRVRWGIASLMIVLLAGVLYQAWYLGVTVDEPSHLTSSHLYWKSRDRLLPRDMPPLIKMVGGWPSVIQGVPLAEDLGQPGDERTEWSEGAMLMRNLDAGKLRQVLFWSRVPMAIFALLTTVVLWLWARELLGERVALAVAALWVFCPTSLAHSSLLKNDIAATGTYLLFWYAAWRFWPEPTLRRTLLLAFCAALAAISKLSMLFLLVVAPLVVLARPGRLRNLPVLAGVVYLLIAAAYQFEMHWTSPAEIAALATDQRVPPLVVAVAHVLRWIPIPEGLWVGIVTLSQSNFGESPVYFAGEVFLHGYPGYFLAATLLKLPWPSLLLFSAGLGVLIVHWRALEVRDTFWLVPGVLYYTLASMSALQHGVRLVLPAWPFLLLIAGIALVRLRRWIIVPVLIQIAMTAANYPNGISHFNPYAGPPEHAALLLNDSNIDWGQALPEVQRFVRENRIEKIHVSYFGFDLPDRYFPRGGWENVPAPWSDQWARGERLKPAPGWYAISASLLPGHFFAPKYRDYYAEFRTRTPVFAAGGSIFVYRID